MPRITWNTNKSEPARRFGIGERARLVDSPTWTNSETRHLIGKECTVVTFTLPPWIGMYHMADFDKFPHVPIYGVHVPGHVSDPFYVMEHSLKRLDEGDDPFAEPRDVSDDTPNKVTTWDAVPWKPAIEITNYRRSK